MFKDQTRTIKSVSVRDVFRTLEGVVVRATCSTGGGPAEDCTVIVVDRGSPASGNDEFHIEVGSYSAAEAC